MRRIRQFGTDPRLFPSPPRAKRTRLPSTTSATLPCRGASRPSRPNDEQRVFPTYPVFPPSPFTFAFVSRTPRRRTRPDRAVPPPGARRYPHELVEIVAYPIATAPSLLALVKDGRSRVIRARVVAVLRLGELLPAPLVATDLHGVGVRGFGRRRGRAFWRRRGTYAACASALAAWSLQKNPWRHLAHRALASSAVAFAAGTGTGTGTGRDRRRGDVVRARRGLRGFLLRVATDGTPGEAHELAEIVRLCAAAAP